MLNNKSQISVTIHKRDGILYQGEAYAVSSTNEVGPFDVLPMHANFVTTIREKVIVTLENGKKNEFGLDTGILFVKEDLIEVFLGI
ncbi:MAG: hypothetical protein HYV90_05405 [Candidatus Woesebacteria bacterium]|nr:MAG: hypothetical protein HYV90_05405 [Candidatus Woesebacteria bacterium]